VLAYSPSSGTFVPLTDVLGSTIGLVNSSGTIATKWAYEPFGVPTSSGQSSNYPYLFAGMEYDPTGLYHTLARYYSPRLQRFTQEDPLQFGGGDINLLAYVGNDPVNLADPLGMDVPGVFAAFGYCMYGFAGDAGALSSGASLSALVAATVDLPNNGFGRASLAFSAAGEFAAGSTANGSIGVGSLGGMAGVQGGVPGATPFSGSAPTGSIGAAGISQGTIAYTQQVAFRMPVPNVPKDFSGSPGEGWEKIGPNWWHPRNKWSLHPDPHHPPPIGPHWDWHRRDAPKMLLRWLGDELQYFDAEVLEWFPSDLLPLE
jgi:RHS repeat-associated protein